MKPAIPLYPVNKRRKGKIQRKPLIVDPCWPRILKEARAELALVCPPVYTAFACGPNSESPRRA